MESLLYPELKPIHIYSLLPLAIVESGDIGVITTACYLMLAREEKNLVLA